MTDMSLISRSVHLCASYVYRPGYIYIRSATQTEINQTPMLALRFSPVSGRDQYLNPEFSHTLCRVKLLCV